MLDWFVHGVAYIALMGFQWGEYVLTGPMSPFAAADKHQAKWWTGLNDVSYEQDMKEEMQDGAQSVVC